MKKDFGMYCKERKDAKAAHTPDHSSLTGHCIEGGSVWWLCRAKKRSLVHGSDREKSAYNSHMRSPDLQYWPGQRAAQANRSPWRSSAGSTVAQALSRRQDKVMEGFYLKSGAIVPFSVLPSGTCQPNLACSSDIVPMGSSSATSHWLTRLLQDCGLLPGGPRALCQAILSSRLCLRKSGTMATSTSKAIQEQHNSTSRRYKATQATTLSLQRTSRGMGTRCLHSLGSVPLKAGPHLCKTAHISLDL